MYLSLSLSLQHFEKSGLPLPLKAFIWKGIGVQQKQSAQIAKNQDNSIIYTQYIFICVYIYIYMYILYIIYIYALTGYICIYYILYI